MKKVYVLTFTAIIVVAIFVSVRIFVGNEMEYRQTISSDSYEFGKFLKEMEEETDREVKARKNDLSEENRSELVSEVEERIFNIIENLPKLENKNVRMKAMRECSIIMKLGGKKNDYEKMPENEIQLKNTAVVNFASNVFAYCLNINDNCNEKADYNILKSDASDLEASMDNNVAKFVDLLIEVNNG